VVDLHVKRIYPVSMALPMRQVPLVQPRVLVHAHPLGETVQVVLADVVPRDAGGAPGREAPPRAQGSAAAQGERDGRATLGRGVGPGPELSGRYRRRHRIHGHRRLCTAFRHVTWKSLDALSRHFVSICCANI
jgi:hypothetical protein